MPWCSYNGVLAYANSKLANVLFSNELARKLEGNLLTETSIFCYYFLNFNQQVKNCDNIF
jgi:hypothetical protein